LTNDVFSHTSFYISDIRIVERVVV